MGFVRKIMGVQAQIDAAQDNANVQEKAIKQSADAAESNAMQAAKSAAMQQAQLAARSVAEQKAVDAASVPLGKVDVSVESDATSTSAVRQRRAKFGKDYTTGVKV